MEIRSMVNCRKCGGSMPKKQAFFRDGLCVNCQQFEAEVALAARPSEAKQSDWRRDTEAILDEIMKQNIQKGSALGAEKLAFAKQLADRLMEDQRRRAEDAYFLSPPAIRPTMREAANQQTIGFGFADPAMQATSYLEKREDPPPPSTATEQGLLMEADRRRLMDFLMTQAQAAIGAAPPTQNQPQRERSGAQVVPLKTKRKFRL